MFAESLDGAAGERVIGSENSRDFTLRGINGLQREKVGLGREPVFRIAIGEDLDVAASNVWLEENVHLCVMESFRALIIWRARDEDNNSLWGAWSTKYCACILPISSRSKLT